MKLQQRSVALVTPWFGNSNGGAEVFCSGLARALHHIGREVEVLTTCCRDPFCSWDENSLPAGESNDHGIAVRRFRVRGRNASLYAHYSGIIDRGGNISRQQEDEFIRNSINSDGLCHYISEHAGEYLFFFLPYLYGTTYFGLRAAPRDHSFLIPCLHNEPFAYLELMQELFSLPAGCLFLSRPERDFASALYDISAKKQLLLGGGLAPEVTADPARFRAKWNIEGPFVLYVGRKVPGKGADLLVRYYDRLRSVYPSLRFKLVLLGSGEFQIPPGLEKRVFSFSGLSTQDIHDAMAGCEFLVHPSFFESFSLVMMEAWLHGKAVLVNGECAVTQYHVVQSNGGLYFTSFGEFCETMRLLAEDPGLCRRLGNAGRKYVLGNYTWPSTVGRLQEFLRELETG